MAAYQVRQEPQDPCLRPDEGIRACLTARCGQLREWHHFARRKRKRESVSSSNVLASSDVEDDANDSVLTGCTNNIGAHNDERDEYLALPQIENNREW